MTHKLKNRLLVIGFVLTLIACYHLAISKTLALKNEHHDLQHEALLFKNTPKQLSILLQKKQYYDSLLNKYQINGTSIQNNLLKTINKLANNSNLKVVSFLEPHVSKTNEVTFKTYQFTIEGNYNDILKLIHHIEQKTKFGEIINLDFQKNVNYKSGTTYLQAFVLLKSTG